LQLLPAGGTPAVTVALDSFQFGFHNTATTGGTATGKASFDALDVTAVYNANSPQVLARLTRGPSYDSAVLTQKDAAGTPVAVCVLKTVCVTDDTVTKNAAGLPGEEVKFAFEALTEANSTGSVYWSQATNSASGPNLPAGLTLGALPSPAATGLTPQLAG